MTAIIYKIITVIWLHWMADFILQTDAMAKGKSTSNKWLGKHIAVYSACLLPFGIKFAILNGVAHFITDYFTSRATSKLWKKGDVHNFFVVIGFDQAIHMTCLILSVVYL